MTNATGQFPNESFLGSLVVAVQVAGPIPGNVVITTAGLNGSFTLTVPASGVASTWRVVAVDAGGGNNGPQFPQTAPFCNNGQICGHGPSPRSSAAPLSRAPRSAWVPWRCH